MKTKLARTEQDTLPWDSSFEIQQINFHLGVSDFNWYPPYQTIIKYGNRKYCCDRAKSCSKLARLARTFWMLKLACSLEPPLGLSTQELSNIILRCLELLLLLKSLIAVYLCDRILRNHLILPWFVTIILLDLFSTMFKLYRGTIWYMTFQSGTYLQNCRFLAKL